MCQVPNERSFEAKAAIERARGEAEANRPASDVSHAVAARMEAPRESASLQRPLERRTATHGVGRQKGIDDAHALGYAVTRLPVFQMAGRPTCHGFERVGNNIEEIGKGSDCNGHTVNSSACQER